MLTKLSVKNFQAVPYLETSQLMTAHKGVLKFSRKKPNVIVGPNGSGKSALLDSLALRFLASQTGISSLDEKYMLGHNMEHLWTNKSKWGHDYHFLEGLEVDTDNGPMLYYRPGHVPGNEHDVTYAMMCGYPEEAREYDALTRNKSSGQKSQGLLQRLTQALAGENLPTAYVRKSWRYGEEPRDVRSQRGYSGPWEYQAEVLKEMFRDVSASAPLLVMDEPEQSLDARAELALWAKVATVDCSKMQVILATHSVYPLLHPGKFHIIETVPGYIEEVKSMLSS